MIDMSVKLGDILIMVSMIGIVVTYIFKAGTYTRSIMALQAECKELKNMQKEMGAVLTQVAVQQSKLESQDRRINDLYQRFESIKGDHK